MKESECLEAIVYMCSKLGIEVVDHRANQQHPKNLWSARAANVYELKLDISPNLFISRTRYLKSIARSFLSTPTWFEWTSSKQMLSIILMTRSFFLDLQNLQNGFCKRWAIGNPFFNHFELLEAENLPQFMLLADLVCPEDKSEEVFEFARKLSA